jgi:hypothetical protein
MSEKGKKLREDKADERNDCAIASNFSSSTLVAFGAAEWFRTCGLYLKDSGSDYRTGGRLS